MVRRSAWLILLFLIPAAQSEVIVGLEGIPEELAVGDDWNGHTVTFIDPTLHAIGIDASSAATITALDFPHVRYAEDDVLMQAYSYVPNDAEWGKAHHHSAPLMEADQLWSTTVGGPNKKVCIADTGIHLAHEDIDAARYLGGYDFVNGDADPADDHGHGTLVAGNLLATINNGVGISGIAQQDYYVAKVLDHLGSGTGLQTAQGIRWCAEQGAAIINLSLGGSTSSQYTQDAVAYASRLGALVLAATGNDGTTGDPSFPAGYPEAMGIGCADSNSVRCSFSNGGDYVSIVAPGQHVYSATYGTTSGYESWSGTSASTPNAAGLAALVWEMNPTLSNWDIRHALEQGAIDLGPAGWDTGYGHGLANGPAADLAAQAMGQTLATVYEETFDDGLAQDWTLTGLFRTDSSCPYSAASPTLAFARTNCDFDQDYASGTASFEVDLSDATGASLSFSHRWNTEDTAYDAEASTAQPSLDQLEVQVRPFGSAAWTTLGFWDSRDAEPTAFDGVSFSLSSFAGQALEVRFAFHARGTTDNTGDGWYIDNVIVRSDGATGQVAIGQDWFLSNDATGMQNDETYLMERGTGGGTGLYSFTGAPASVVWASNEEALAAAAFGSEAWRLSLAFVGFGGSTDFSVPMAISLGHTAPDGTYSDTTPPSTTTITLDGQGGMRDIILEPAGDLTIPQGHRIALKMTPTLDAGESVAIDLQGTQGASFLSSGLDDPGYPTPNFGTSILLASGLAIVAGGVYVRKRA